jgi:hypothetical protein
VQVDHEVVRVQHALIQRPVIQQSKLETLLHRYLPLLSLLTHHIQLANIRSVHLTQRIQHLL